MPPRSAAIYSVLDEEELLGEAPPERDQPSDTLRASRGRSGQMRAAGAIVAILACATIAARVLVAPSGQPNSASPAPAPVPVARPAQLQASSLPPRVAHLPAASAPRRSAHTARRRPPRASVRARVTTVTSAVATPPAPREPPPPDFGFEQ